jgi:hypothetical protein
MWWCTLYGFARGGLDALAPTWIKGWPLSSYIVALAHQLVVLPVLWWGFGDVGGCFSSSFAYFATDFFMNISSFDRAHVIHHAVSLVLLTAGPLLLPPETLRLSTGWLVVLELGSSGISLTDITGGRFRTLRFLLYCCTRVVVIADTAFVFATHRDTPTMLCCMASLPLIAHNVCVMNHLWRGMRKREKK